MEEFNLKRNQVPAFGSWDCYDGDVPFTECFEAARGNGVLRYSYSEDRDLYVAGDLYENDVVTPAMIVVPRHRAKLASYEQVKEGKEGWRKVCDCDMKETPSPVSSPPLVAAAAGAPPPPKRAPKPVDEDLYKISPHLLHAQSTRKKRWGFFLGCLLPTCIR